MRLIDADKLYTDLANGLTCIMGDGTNGRDIDTYVMIGDIIREVIDEQSAYDVDKVVRQLEAYSNADEAERLGTMPVVELADAIKIVKGGGVGNE